MEEDNWEDWPGIDEDWPDFDSIEWPETDWDAFPGMEDTEWPELDWEDWKVGPNTVFIETVIKNIPLELKSVCYL